MDISKNAVLLYAAINGNEKEAGKTVDLTGAPLPLRGYFVGVTGVVLTAQTATLDVFHAFVKAHANARFLGVWREGNAVYLDTVVYCETFREAASFGHLYNQKAIYSIGNDETITL